MSVGLRANRITMRPTGGSVQASVDINGYYAPQIEAQIGSNGVIYSATSRIVSANRVAMGQYAVTIDRNVTNCSFFLSIYTTSTNVPSFANGYNSGPIVHVSTYTNNALADEAFEIAVHC